MNTLESIPRHTMTFGEYIREVEVLVKEKSTSGPNQSEDLIDYTLLNYRRMKRQVKTTVIDADIKTAVEKVAGEMVWAAITEAWCGDAAQNIPYIGKLAEACSNVELHVIYRDEHPAFMAHYLTNGAKSIPKLIGFDRETAKELFVWGPRPEPMQKLVMNNKALPEGQTLPYEELAKSMHGWYAKDKNQTLRKELLHILGTL